MGASWGFASRELGSPPVGATLEAGRLRPGQSTEAPTGASKPLELDCVRAADTEGICPEGAARTGKAKGDRRVFRVLRCDLCLPRTPGLSVSLLAGSVSLALVQKVPSRCLRARLHGRLLGVGRGFCPVIGLLPRFLLNTTWRWAKHDLKVCVTLYRQLKLVVLDLKPRIQSI